MAIAEQVYYVTYKGEEHKFVTEDLCTVTFQNVKTEKMVRARKEFSNEFEMGLAVGRGIAPIEIRSFPVINEFNDWILK